MCGVLCQLNVRGRLCAAVRFHSPSDRGAALSGEPAGQVAQPGSVYTVPQQVNRQARPAAVKLMHGSASEEVHCDTSISRPKVDPKRTMHTGVAAD